MIRFEDLRSLDTGAARRRLEILATGMRPEHTPGAYLTAWQAQALATTGLLESGLEIGVTAPDFLNYARLLNTGQAMSLARLSGGLGRAARAGLAASPALMAHPLRAAGMDFWLIAEVLLRYDLALLPSSFRGTVMLHSYLADFAFLFERRDFVTGFFGRVPEKRGGVHTQQLPLALSCLARWGVRPACCSFLFSPADGDGHAAYASARSFVPFEHCRFIGEIESLPVDLQGEELVAAVQPPVSGWLASAGTFGT